MDGPRPVEDYVIARITIQERLARLTKIERMAVIMSACGFNMADWGRVRGTHKNTEGDARQRGLRKVQGD